MKILPLILLLALAPLCRAALPHPDVAAGHALYLEGRGNSAQFAQALEHYLAAAEAEDAEGQLYAGLLYELGQGTDADVVKARYWYLRASEQGQARSYGRLGGLHYRGDGTAMDVRRALEYYRQGAQAGDPSAQAELAIILFSHGDRDSAEIDSLFAMVEASGDPEVLYSVGQRLAHRMDKRLSARGVDYLLLAAEQGHLKSLEELMVVLRIVGVRDRISSDKAQWIRDQVKLVGEQAKAFAQQRLEEVAPLVQEQRYEEALAVLERDHALFLGSIRQWRSAYGAAIWWEAQTRSGRADPEWGWRLFEWVSHRYDEGMQSNSQARILVLSNTASRLREVGRIGKLHEISNRLSATLLELDGIDVGKIFANARWQGGRVDVGSLPLQYTREMKPHLDNVRGYWLQRGSMASILALADERLLAGDWRKAVFLCDWVEAWAYGVLADPSRDKPRIGDTTDTLNFALLRRAQIYELLHYPEQAEATYRTIIRQETGAYRGRSVDWAKARLALLMARNGKALELDLEELRALAAKQNENIFTPQSSQHIAFLAEALILQAQGQGELARARVEQTLDYARSAVRPLLLLDALETSVDLYLLNAQYELAQAQLFEALAVARSLGLKVAEPELYRRYVESLRHGGDFKSALVMQTELIALLRRFAMTEALPQAEALRQSLYEQYAASMLGERRQDEGGSFALVGGAQNGFEIDLQPVRTLSIPLPGRAVEAVFVLFNLGRDSGEITLHATANASLAFAEGGTLLEVIGAADDLRGEATATLTLEGGHQQKIRVRSANVDSITPVIGVQLSAMLGSARIRSELEFRLDAGAAGSAVIDAHLLEDNPFYLIPVYHHLSAAGRKWVGLRTVASEPTRVEAYDEEGYLLFVDAEGNGSFTDPGDLLATRLVSGAVPLLEVGGADRLIEFRYKVHNPQRGTGVEVRIERSPEPDSGVWHTDVIDTILLSPRDSTPQATAR